MSTPFEFLNLGLVIVPHEICRRTDHRTIWLWHNKLTDLPEKFVRLKKLKDLYLNNNLFKVFPKLLCRLENLHILDMSHNMLDDTSLAGIACLRLRRLVLSNNQLRKFPEEVTEIKDLQELFLGWNVIETLPPSIGKMTELQMLKINDNRICAIPEEIEKLVQLRCLNIEMNNVARLPPQMFLRLKNLESFECDRNPLVSPPEYICTSGVENIRNYQNRKPNETAPPRSVHIETCDNSTEDDYDTYKMDTDPRGLALVFNNKTFHKNPNDPRSILLQNRPGTDIDAEKLGNLWKKLKFTVLNYEDLNASDMLDVLWSTRLINHHKYSCMIVCVLSHGTLGRVCGCDGITITLQELARPFTPKFCPGLVGKPKLFFIQACQGEQSQSGSLLPSPPPLRDAISFQSPSVAVPLGANVLLSSNNVVTLATSEHVSFGEEAIASGGISKPIPATISMHSGECKPSQESHSLTSDQRFQSEVSSIPNEADFLYGFCTVPGYEAYRDPDPSEGSWYISKLVQSIEKYASKKHLLDILIHVNKGVAEKGNSDFKQMPAPQFTLRKKVLFV